MFLSKALQILPKWIFWFENKPSGNPARINSVHEVKRHVTTSHVADSGVELSGHSKAVSLHKYPGTFQACCKSTFFRTSKSKACFETAAVEANALAAWQ
jgi:hypothetical protein